MNTDLRLTLLSISITALFCSSCGPKDEIEIGGKGGNATLNITPRHHSNNIDSCKVYIKYNVSDKPLTYDDSAWCRKVGDKPVATFGGLKKGKYYLYARGWDASIAEAVDGGAPYQIKDEVTFDYNLAVTEDH